MARWLKGPMVSGTKTWAGHLGGVGVGLEVGALRNCQELAVTHNRSSLWSTTPFDTWQLCDTWRFKVMQERESGLKLGGVF